MQRGDDERPSVFKTFCFASFNESAAFVAHLAHLGAEVSSLIQAKVTQSGVRIRIDPHPQEGKEGARRILEDLKVFYRDRF